MQNFMMISAAHALAAFYFSSFKREKTLARLAVEMLFYLVVVAVAFSPVLDGNNWFYLLAVVLYHIITSPIVRLAGKRSGRAYAVAFAVVEVVRLVLFVALSFIRSVRWGQFEPWRDVRFFLLQFDLSFNEVLSWAFVLVLALRPANLLVRTVLGLVGEDVETAGMSGAALGIAERILYLCAILYGSYLAFAIIFFAKCALFCLAIRNDAERGMRIYLGSIVSALSVIPLSLIAGPFF